jgi:hypothetical protein
VDTHGWGAVQEFLNSKTTFWEQKLAWPRRALTLVGVDVCAKMRALYPTGGQWMDVQTIQMIANIATTIALIAIVVQAWLVWRVYKKSHDWNRRIETQRYINSYNRLEVVFALDKEFHHITKRQAIPLLEILNKIEDNRELRLYLFRLLNYHEELAIGLNMGIYDEEIVKENSEDVIRKTYVNFSEFIKYLQAEDGRDVYKRYQELVESWETKPRKKPRTG